MFSVTSWFLPLDGCFWRLAKAIKYLSFTALPACGSFFSGTLTGLNFYHLHTLRSLWHLKLFSFLLWRPLLHFIHLVSQEMLGWIQQLIYICMQHISSYMGQFWRKHSAPWPRHTFISVDCFQKQKDGNLADGQLITYLRINLLSPVSIGKTAWNDCNGALLRIQPDK